MKKYIFALFVFAFISTFIFGAKPVMADGMVIKPDPYSNRWDYSDEESQQAFINYENGFQKMIISIGLDSVQNDGAVWLFPVPADPSKVVIDVVDEIPGFNGEEVSEKAKMNLNTVGSLLSASQLYTIPFLGGSTQHYEANDVVLTSGSDSAKSNSIKQDVTVYEHIDKDGITSEIITAKTATGLYRYLSLKGLNIESDSIPVIREYIGKNFSFVVSWVTNPYKNIPIVDDNGEEGGEVEEDANTDDSGTSAEPTSAIIEQDDSYYYDNYDYYNQRGVYVTFPTNEIYFPLLPTSVYGSKVVPATIKIIGHVTPKVFNDIKSYTTTSYYIDTYADISSNLDTFYSDTSESLKYTKIEINAPSKYLTDDLWVSNKAPFKTHLSTFVAQQWGIVLVTLMIISSILSSLLVGFFVFSGQKKNTRKLVLVGLSNCLSILGVIATVSLMNEKTKNEEILNVLQEIKKKGYNVRRIISRLAFFFAILLIIASMFSTSSYGFGYGGFGYNSYFTLWPIIIYLLPFVLIIVGFKTREIKLQDKDLFIQLNEFGYSQWSLNKKDGRKFIFLPVFSIVFLVISWMLVELVRFIV